MPLASLTDFILKDVISLRSLLLEEIYILFKSFKSKLYLVFI